MKVRREKVWDKYNHHCAYCGNDLEYKDMQVDHFIPQRLAWWFKTDVYISKYNLPRDINHINNLMPSCRRCNHYKRSELPENFRETMKTIHDRIAQIYICKVAKDYNIIEFHPWDGLFYFEKHNKMRRTKTIFKENKK